MDSTERQFASDLLEWSRTIEQHGLSWGEWQVRESGGEVYGPALPYEPIAVKSQYEGGAL